MFDNPVKRSLVLPEALDAALVRLAEAQRRDVNSCIVETLERHALASGALAPDEVSEVQLFWSLVDRVVETAKELCRDGDFVPEITLRAIERRMQADPSWAGDYARLVRDDIFRTGNPRKGPINREIGYRVRAGIGGQVRVDANGKSAAMKVLGSIVQSVTLMDAFDPAAVAR